MQGDFLPRVPTNTEGLRFIGQSTAQRRIIIKDMSAGANDLISPESQGNAFCPSCSISWKAGSDVATIVSLRETCHQRTARGDRLVWLHENIGCLIPSELLPDAHESEAQFDAVL